MENIFDTEAGILKRYNSTTVGVITKLSGFLGEEFLKIHPKVITYINGCEISSDCNSFYGFGFMVDRSNNFIKVCTNVKLFSIHRNDHLFFHFQDKTSLKVNFLTSGFTSGNEKHLLTIISTNELDHFATQIVEYIEIIKNGISVKFSFDACGNTQYNSIENGQRLFQIMAQRVSGARQLLTSLVC